MTCPLWKQSLMNHVALACTPEIWVNNGIVIFSSFRCITGFSRAMVLPTTVLPAALQLNGEVFQSDILVDFFAHVINKFNV